MSNRPNNTAHLYEASEVNSMQLNGLRLGKVGSAVFSAIERDVSGNGKAAFSTNFVAAVEDIGVSNPNSIIMALVCYNRWYNLMKQKFKGSTGKSYTCPEARQLLIACTVSLARSMKSRIEPDLSYTSLNLSTKQVAKMNPEDFEVDPEVKKACSWVSKLGPATGLSQAKGLDAKKIVDLFAVLLCKTADVWGKIANKRVQLAKQEVNPCDPDIDFDAINDKEADEVVVIEFEKNLIMLGQMIYAIDSHEKRRLPKMKPEFVTRALDAFTDRWKHQFPKISGKSEKMFSRPVAWMFAPLLEIAYKMYGKKSTSTVLVLLGLLELCAIEIGNDRSNFLAAIIFATRCRTLEWKKNEINPQGIVSEEEIAELMRLYDECPPMIEGSDNDDILDPIKLAARRKLSVPQEYLDRTTFRGRGKNTMEYLTKGANAIGVDISSWTKEETDKSHGAGIELHKKQSEGVPTYMSFYLDNSTVLSKEQDKVENPYRERARECLMNSEEKYGHGASYEKDMASRAYEKWLKAFSTDLPESSDDGDEGKGKKKKVKVAAKKRKNGSADRTKDVDVDVGEEKMIIVQKKTKDGFEPTLKPGSLIRIVKIVYEKVDDPSDEDTDDYVKKRVVMQERRGGSDEEDSEEEAKKISKLKKNQDRLKAAVGSSKRPSKKSTKQRVDDDDDETEAPPSRRTEKRKKVTGEEEPEEERQPAKKQKKSKANDLAKFNILEVVEYSTMSDEEKEALASAPLAQKPIGNAKKFVYIVGDKVYKGPYNPVLSKDVEAIQRVLYRIFRMKSQWNDTILVDQDLVYNGDDKMLYMVSDNVGRKRGYETEEITLNTHDKKTVEIVRKETLGAQLLSKVIQSENFERFVGPAMVDLAARYLIGSGGGHFGEIIVSKNGELASIDVEDNREKVPIYSHHPTPHLLDILFVNKKQPAKSNDKFYTLLPSTFDDLKEFIKTVKCENTEETAAYAQKICYTGAPAQEIIDKRLETLEKCIRDNEESRKNFKTNGDGIPELPDYNGDAASEIAETI